MGAQGELRVKFFLMSFYFNLAVNMRSFWIDCILLSF